MIFADMNSVLSNRNAFLGSNSCQSNLIFHPRATRMCVFRILRSTSINNIPEDYHETCNIFPLREAKYTIAPWWTRNGLAPCEVHPQQFWPESWSGSYWRWLMYQILGVFFGREIPENIKGHRVVGEKDYNCWPDDSTQICKMFMHTWCMGVRSFEDKMMLPAKICFWWNHNLHLRWGTEIHKYVCRMSKKHSLRKH